MADNESDLETDGLELALETLCSRHCSKGSSLKSKDYCTEFCELVEEYTGQWHVPLPQLKVLRTALCNFTKATAAFPDDCQHIHYVLSSLALSFFELMLFFSKEEFVEEPLKDILESFQECHSQLMRHRNIYLQHVKHTIKAGGPWENPVLQGILKEADLPQNEVEDYLTSELPIFLELRVRYLRACERMQEAMSLAKSCLENRQAGKHLYFHQAYLTCLYKASLHENLHKEMAEIDGRDAVEIICNTESVEKDELLLSLCKAFLTQQLHNGDMYYIWDLVFIWSRLHLRAHPSRDGFLAECLQLASSATNVRAIFPFIKLVTAELGSEGVQVCVELCARALQLCDMQADTVTRSLVCKTIAFLLPRDLEICRACALLVFCQERSLEAYRTVCLLYMHPDEELHPHNNPVRTNVRFHTLQMLKERLCFDPEFWNLLTLRTHCLELISDNVMKAAVLNEMEEEQKEYSEESTNHCVNDTCTQELNLCHADERTLKDVSEEPVEREKSKCVDLSDNAPLKKRKWRRKLREREQSMSDEEFDIGDDPEIKYNLQTTSSSNKPMYSLRRNHNEVENFAVKLPRNRNREYLSRCVKSQIFKRKGRKKRWLQGLPRLDQVQTVKEQKVKIKFGKKRGRKPLSKLELTFPDNEILLTKEESGAIEKTNTNKTDQDMSHQDFDNKAEQKENCPEQRENGEDAHLVSEGQEPKECQPQSELCESCPSEPPAAPPAVEGSPELDGPLLWDCPVELLHSYSLKSKAPESEDQQPPGSDELNGDTDDEVEPAAERRITETEVKAKATWRERVLRTQQYGHLAYYCKFCNKKYKGLNVMRHVLSHLKNKKLRCILCGKRFKQFSFAKKHVLEHIDAMCKEKPSDKLSCTEDIPAANGIIDHGENQDETETEQKPGGKSKLSRLSREERIIRNLRTLIKKRCVLFKKCKNPDSSVFKQVDFKDEQVVITDGLVIVKDQPQIETEIEDGEAKETPTGENGFSGDITYHLCPSESCDRVFLRISSTLTKHAIKCHIGEEKVLEKTFAWSKHKCTLCLRQIQSFQHYKDHMKLHNTALPHFCYHLECNQRFLTPQELKNHVNSHKPFRPQCTFTDCEKLFANLIGLYDHEWRHYIPVPSREEVESGPAKQLNDSAEAPWKQRVKVEEMWLQNKKVQRDSPTLDADTANLEELGERSKSENQACALHVSDNGQTPSTCDNCSDDSKTTVNGYENVSEDLMSSSHSNSDSTTPSKRCRKKRPVVQWDPLNVRDLEEMSTLSEGVQQKLEEPHITEHKTFKPEDPSYATFVKAPFIRPPPSTYLDESLLSMKKRRIVEESPPKKYVYWGHKKSKDLLPEKERKVEEAVVPEQKTRHRCEKCLSSFSSLEELQKHQALNTCSALFGFDSDDES